MVEYKQMMKTNKRETDAGKYKKKNSIMFRRFDTVMLVEFGEKFPKNTEICANISNIQNMIISDR